MMRGVDESPTSFMSPRDPRGFLIFSHSIPPSLIKKKKLTSFLSYSYSSSPLYTHKHIYKKEDLNQLQPTFKKQKRNINKLETEIMMKDMNGVGVGVGVGGSGSGSGGDGVSSSSSTTSSRKLQGATSSSSSNGAGAALRPQGNIRKNRKPEDAQLFLRRIKQYLLYSKLRSLIPSPAQQEKPFHIDHQFGGRHEEATEMDMELHEIPTAYRSDSDHDDQENIKVITVPKSNTNIGNDDDHYDLLVLETKQEQDEDEAEDEVEDEDDDEEEDGTCVTTIIFESDDEEEKKQPEKAFVPSVKIERMENTILINTVVLKQKALTSSFFKILEEENLDIVFENQYRTETKVCHTVQVRLVHPTATDDHQYNVDRLEKRLQKWAKGEPEPML